MDKEFVGHYYDVAYFNAEQKAMQGDKEYRESQHYLERLEKDLMKLCGGQSTAAWVRYEEISLEREAMTGRVLRAVYLLGAEDRERMLKQ